MKVFLQLILIPILIVVAHYTSILTYGLAQGLKTGSYVTPLFGWKFSHWLSFVFVSLAALQVFYLLSGMILFVAYKLTLDYFHVMYPAVILNMVAIIFWTILMMYIKVKEVPTRDGWIALSLVVIASLLAMNAGRNLKP